MSTRPASTLLWVAVGAATIATIYYFATRKASAATPTPPAGFHPGGVLPIPSGGGAQGIGPLKLPPLRFPKTVDINTQDPNIPVTMNVGDRLLATIVGWSLAVPPNSQVLAPVPDGSFVARAPGTAQLTYVNADGTTYPPFTVVVS